MSAIAAGDLPVMHPDPAYIARIEANVPQEMRDAAQWLVWKWAHAPAPKRNAARGNTGAGKLTKVPYNPHTGRKGDTTDAAKWGTFAQARACYMHGGYAGLGFVFTRATGVVGVDLDACRDPHTGELAPWAQAIIDSLASYTEASPSGTGVHILVCGELPHHERARRRAGAIEVYDADRFFTVTGERLDGTPAGIEERGRALAELYRATFGEEAPKPSPARAPRRAAALDTLPASDSELLALIEQSEQGPKFSALWRGDTSGYESASQADYALLGVLRFWTRGDPGRMDSLFRQSELMRDKWDVRHFADGATYGAGSIARSLAGPFDIWQPGRRPAPVWTPETPAPAPGMPGAPDAPGARKRRPTQRPQRTRVPLLAATPEQNARMLWLEVNDYFTDESRTYLYTYHERAQELAGESEGEGEEGAQEEGEEGEEEERPGYYRAVNTWGMPRLVGEYHVDLGGERPREEYIYRLEWSTHPERGVHDVTREKLDDASCWAIWPDVPISTRRERETYANVVKAQARAFGISLVEGRTATGLYRDDARGAWFYLQPDGRCMDARGACDPAPLWGYDLATRAPHRARAFAEGMPTIPVPVPSLADVRALAAFYGRVSPHGHLAITVGAALRSLVCSIAPAQTALLAEGDAECGKTSTGKHARGVIGPSPFSTEADAHFNATETNIEQLLAPLRDVPALLDNFRIKPTDTAADIRRTAESLDRVVLSAESGDVMRGRGGRTGKPQKGNRIATLALINGEKLPPALVSTLRRIMHLPYHKGVSLDLDMMAAEEATYQPTLTAVGHTVLRYVLDMLDHDAGELRALIERQEGAYTARLMAAVRDNPPDGEVYRSIPGNWARVLTGWRLAEWALGLAQPRGDVDADGELVAAVLPHVEQWMCRQMRLAADGGPLHLSAEWVWSATLTAFEAGMMHALDRAGVPLDPQNAPGLLSDWGYARTVQGDWVGRGKAGALLDMSAGLLYIKTRAWEAALAEIASKQARERGAGPEWTLNEQTFAGAMLRLGVTVPKEGSPRPATHLLKVSGKPDRFAAVRLADLFGDTEVSPIEGNENSGYSGYSGYQGAPAGNSTGVIAVTASGPSNTEAVTAVTVGEESADAWEAPAADVGGSGDGFMCPRCGGTDTRDYGAGPVCYACDVPVVTAVLASSSPTSASEVPDASEERPAADVQAIEEEEW